MFTGLIEEIGTISGIERKKASARLSVETSYPPAEVQLGDSIAVNGVCLTVTDRKGSVYFFDASPETMQRSGLRSLERGSKVNLERALRLSDRLGGHIVTGHVDCLATITERRETAENIVFAFRLPPCFCQHLAEKGSVAIDGISLTVNSVSDDSFTVNVIPHTASRTALTGKKRGDEVNIETDILSKYLARLLSVKEKGGQGSVTLDLLAKNGFL